MVSAIDFSWARPSPQSIKAAGVTYVLRYLARGGGGKVLTANEAKEYLNVGLGVALNFEQEADAPKKGASRGVEDARFANDLADTIGAPKDAWIWYSCDTFATLQQVAPYYKGVQDVGRRPSAYYGGFPVGLQLQAQGIVKGVWCANAASWSGYRSWGAMAEAARGTNVCMIQHLDHPLPGLNPNDYDYNEVLKMTPMWGLTHPPEPPKKKVRKMYFFFRVPDAATDQGKRDVWVSDGIYYERTTPDQLAAMQWICASQGMNTNIGTMTKAQLGNMQRVGP